MSILAILTRLGMKYFGGFGLGRLGFGRLRKDGQPHWLFSRWEEKIQRWPR